MKNTALVLEGGALRSLYTAGVLDAFMEQGLQFPYVIGVSAGALCGLNYISRQPGRTAAINIGYCDNKEYISYRNRLRRGGIINLDFVFAEPQGRWTEFDADAYNASTARFIIVATSIETGEAIYIYKPKPGEELKACMKASCALPLLASRVQTPYGICMDGGIADSIPYQKALDDGCERIVAVRTRERTYRKKETPAPERGLYRTAYRGHDAFIETAIRRPEVYNSQIEGLYQLEAQGKAFIIEPQKPVEVSRMEHDKEKLQSLYMEGKADAERLAEELKCSLDASL